MFTVITTASLYVLQNKGLTYLQILFLSTIGQPLLLKAKQKKTETVHTPQS